MTLFTGAWKRAKKRIKTIGFGAWTVLSQLAFKVVSFKAEKGR